MKVVDRVQRLADVMYEEEVPREVQVYYAVKRPRTFLRNAVHTRIVCNTYKPAPATDDTR